MKKKPAQYIQGIVVPVPRKNLARYKKWIHAIGPIWMENGAIEVHDCVGDYLRKGHLTSFPEPG